MGDIADMMLDGTLCEHCGQFIDANPTGYPPQYCSKLCAALAGAGIDARLGQPAPMAAFRALPATYVAPHMRARRVGAYRRLPYRCATCSKTFTTPALLLAHRMNNHE